VTVGCGIEAMEIAKEAAMKAVCLLESLPA
jgi:hypothetical protein